MRPIKILVLVTAAAIVATAVVDSAVAQAKHLVVLCKKDPGTGLCPAGELIKVGTFFFAKLESFGGNQHAIFLSEGLLGNELCEASELLGEITRTSKIHAKIKQLAFSKNCKPCSLVETNATPASSYLVEFTHNEFGEHLWQLLVTRINIEVKFTGCPLGVTCKYATADITLDANNRVSTPLILTLKNEFQRTSESSGLCPANTLWDSNYVITSPSDSFFALDEKEEI